MAKLSYSTDEIMAHHPYVRPHIEAGLQFHGGFDAQGRYISPRTLNRLPAIDAWAEALRARGFELFDCSELIRGHFPTVEQQRFLLSLGMGETLWDPMTVTGVIEQRGRRIADAVAPDFQAIIVEDISNTATGHLNKGLLMSHGLDEGGCEQRREGGHGDMWFAVRDIAFGKDAYPLPNVPESLAKPETGRLMPQIPQEYEYWIVLLMNALMIETRAEDVFQFCMNVLRDPANFRDRRADALLAAELVERIRQDETPHVGYLTTVLSELRSFTFRAADGATVSGVEMIEPVWRGVLYWHSVTNNEFVRRQARAAIVDALGKRANGRDLVRRFNALDHKEAAQ